MWGISIVRDEADVIGYTVERLLAEGLDRVVVVDNGTGDLLGRMGGRLPIIVVDDHLMSHHQGVKTTRLARAAARAGAAWVIPFDADELWFSPDGRTVAEALRSATCDIAVAPMWNQLPDPDTDDADERNPYLRLRNCATASTGGVKVAFKSHPWVRVAPGNHNVRRPGRRAALLGVRHVPYRSPDQIVGKYRNGAAALELGLRPSACIGASSVRFQPARC